MVDRNPPKIECSRHAGTYYDVKEGCELCAKEKPRRSSSPMPQEASVEPPGAQSKTFGEKYGHLAGSMSGPGAPCPPEPIPGVVEADPCVPPPSSVSQLLWQVLQDPKILDGPSAMEILRECLELAKFLMEKNAAYGDSALDPVRVLCKADPAEQIRVRMDDKLSRMMRGHAAGEDAMHDLVGYWILLQVLERRDREKQP